MRGGGFDGRTQAALARAHTRAPATPHAKIFFSVAIVWPAHSLALGSPGCAWD
jgi:hypothetical protein